MFDGYDELARDKRESIAKQILELAANNPECTIVISSRPDDLFQSWQAFSTFNVQPLTQEQVLSLIEKIKYDDDAKKKFSERIKRDLWNRHRSFLSSPLLATMMLMTFSQFADIPSKVHLFYDQAFDTLFYKHDAVKELYQRKMHSNLTSDLFRKYFSLFCLVSYYDHAVEFSEQEIRKYIEKGIRIEGDTVDIEAFLRDLTESICIMQKDGANYVFSHRSFQEYFAAFCLDRVLQPHAKAILDKIALRVSDTTVPMLLDMNKDLVEKSFILPFAEKMHTEVGEPRKSGFVERYFVACDSSMYLEFSESKLVEWDIHPGAAETLTQTILRLYPHLYEDVGTRSYHELDEEVIAGFFPGWDPRKRRRLQSQRRSSERDKVTKLTIRARKVDKSPAKFFSSLNGESVPKTHDLSWIAKLGYAKYCRDSIAALYKIEADILSRRKAKVENIEDLLR